MKLKENSGSYGNAYQKHEERKQKLKQLAEKAQYQGLLKLATALGIAPEDLLRILAGVQGITLELGRKIDLHWIAEFGTVKVEVPKPFLEPEIIVPELPEATKLPVESSVFDAVYKLIGKREAYKVPNIKDVLPEIIEDVNYDRALHRVLPEIRYIINVFFKGHLSMEEEKGISPGTTSQVPEFRRFELEIIHKNEQQYVFIYGKGTIINSIGDLPVEKIIAVLKKEGKWEA